MSAPSETHTGDASKTDPSMEVVAEESADGTYEIRVTRGAPSPGGAPVLPVTPRASVAESTGSTRAAPERAGGVPRAAIGAGAAVVGAAAIALAIATRPSSDFAPPPIPPPVEPTDFEVFRISVPSLPSVPRSVLAYDAGGGAGEGEGSGEGGEEQVPVFQQIEPLPLPETDQVGQEAEVVPLVDEVPDLDDVTRNQLREIQVEAPVLVGTPSFELPAVEDEQAE